MKLVNVTITKRVSDGNYGFDEVSLSGAIDENDNAAECIARVKQEVHSTLGLAVDPVLPPVIPTEKPAIAASVTKTPDVEADKKKAADKKEAAEKVIADKAAAKALKDSEAADKKAAKEVAAADKKAAAALKKTVQYDRSEKSHKTEFGKVLLGLNANWQKECAAAAKDASVSLAGTPMMDGEGKVLASFIELVEAAITPEDL
jgi:primosomal protein N'